MNYPRSVIGKKPADDRTGDAINVEHLNIEDDEGHKDRNLKKFPPHRDRVIHSERLNNGI